MEIKYNFRVPELLLLGMLVSLLTSLSSPKVFALPPTATGPWGKLHNF